jgi:quinol monooxygenase YgiN
MARTKMPIVALQVTVSDYAKWRPIFDKYRSSRAEAGFKDERVFRNVDDPNEIIIWGEATSGSKLRRALASPELKAAMKEAGGVTGTLKLHVIPYSSDAVIA